MDKKSTKKQDWHTADIIAALHKKQITLKSLAAQAGMSSSTLSRALRKKHSSGEKIIADAIGVEASEIWPSRWTSLVDNAESAFKETKSRSGFVFISQAHEVVTDSFYVAKYFGKRHANVIQKIRNIDCSRQFAHQNFKVCYKTNELQNGKMQPFYEITKDGFVFLAMGFTGHRATAIKERYINAFNQMEAALQKKLSVKDYYHYPLETAGLFTREFANALLDVKEILNGRQPELELREQLKADDYDGMDIRMRVLAIALIEGFFH